MIGKNGVVIRKILDKSGAVRVRVQGEKYNKSPQIVPFTFVGTKQSIGRVWELLAYLLPYFKQLVSACQESTIPGRRIQAATICVPSEVEPTVVLEVKSSDVPKVEHAVAPEVKSTGVLEVECTVAPEIKSTGVPEVEHAVAPEVKSTCVPEVERTVAPEDKGMEAVQDAKNLLEFVEETIPIPKNLVRKVSLGE